MNKTFVINYEENLLNVLKNEQLIVISNSLDDIEQQYKNAVKHNKVIAMVIIATYTSVSQLNLKENWDYIPLVIQAYNIGNYDLFFMNLDIIKHLNVRILLNCKSESIYTDLKILASVGIDCGIILNEGDMIDDDKMLDLASYYYMSLVPHATIEPFEYILRHVAGDYNSNFDEAYFKNSTSYKQLLSIDDLKKDRIDEVSDWDLKMTTYYNHFINLDVCSKCSAFKICNKKMLNCLKNCQQTMAEIFEYAELRNELNKNNEIVKTICQL